MKDFTFISFFIAHNAGNVCRALLSEHGLLEEARGSKLNRDWQLGLDGGCKLRLRATDPRLAALVESLEARGITVLRRHDREFSKTELDAAPWLILRVATAGLYGGVDYDQPYDYSRACAICGAGAQPEAPLIAELGKFGKKQVDHLVYEGHLIASQPLVTRLLEQNLGGITAESVRTERKPPSSNYVWLRVHEVLPPCHISTQGLVRELPCPACDRSGYFWTADSPWGMRLGREPTADFSVSWEYFGDWKQSRGVKQKKVVGGAQEVIVSQRAKRALHAAGAKRLLWIPAEIRDSAASNVPSAGEPPCRPKADA